MPSPFPALCELTNVVDVERVRHINRATTVDSHYQLEILFRNYIDIAIYILRLITMIKSIRIIITITIIIIIITITIESLL